MGGDLRIRMDVDILDELSRRSRKQISKLEDQSTQLSRLRVERERISSELKPYVEQLTEWAELTEEEREQLPPLDEKVERLVGEAGCINKKVDLILKEVDEGTKIHDDLMEKRERIRQMRKHKSKFISFMIVVHEVMNFFGSMVYRSVVPKKFDVPREEAQERMDGYVRDVHLDDFEEYFREMSENKLDLEEQLQTLGTYYLHLESLREADEKVMWELALQYDLKGIVPRIDEELTDFIYRGNTLLHLHKHAREKMVEMDVKVESSTMDVKMKFPSKYAKLVRREDMEEANKKIPYYMDLAWVAAYVKDKKDFILPALGITFTMPQYNSINFIQMRQKYKTRDFFIEVLSHEMVHAGTVYLDTRRDFLETKAYQVGRGSLIGEYAVAMNHRPNILIRGAQFVLQSLMLLPIPDYVFKYLPKARMGLQIARTTGTYKAVKKRLNRLYGEKGGYILGRLTGDEMEKFRYTNDVAGRVAVKDGLKWRIMKENFGKLE